MGHVFFCRLPALHLDARSLSSTCCVTRLSTETDSSETGIIPPAANFSIGALQIPSLPPSAHPSLPLRPRKVPKYPSTTIHRHRILANSYCFSTHRLQVHLDPFMRLQPLSPFLHVRDRRLHTAPCGGFKHRLHLRQSCIMYSFKSGSGKYSLPFYCHCSAACRSLGLPFHPPRSIFRSFSPAVIPRLRAPLQHIPILGLSHVLGARNRQTAHLVRGPQVSVPAVANGFESHD